MKEKTMRYYYDFHIHTALSPCGDNDMTPNNVVNMSLLKGLDIIAVTDHNSMQNAAAVAEVGKRNGLIVVFGMEIETAEEVHVVALFPDGKSARKSPGYHIPTYERHRKQDGNLRRAADSE